ncbi:hypothetical protein FNO89_03655 [Campylobacter coli]|uniref:hypothetical protein n=1 Tax=Campylobacter coli TaxID=195 RepID=UPI000257C923|nr:hypothetical protein [Campylobacter coli]EAH9557137.1 hypothetical protein [Campylobacter coli]EAI2142409.1 hypothetical protein [Campylobacter coli]EAI2385785.1 hypothetical protein [Campylobacter coli]EAI3594525.1 hypothetical protein [Campylobacter coli]EAI4172345.1 hypothetical protein [Campylobacter coli]
MNQIEQFLENLSPREKILIYLTTILLAILLSFHFYHSYLKSFFNHEFFIQSNDMDKIITTNQDLNQQIKQLEKELVFIQDKIKSHENYLNVFNKNHETYIKNLQNLALENNLWISNIEWLQSEENSYRKISLNIFGDFSPILSFMKQLENSDLHYQIHKFEIDNTTSLNLHLKLTLSFISLAKLK